MARRSAGTVFAVFRPDESVAVPLYRQLYDAIRAAILDGRLAGGSRLPSTRLMAAEVGVSRNTVLSAFLQLLAEGYIEGKVGAGTYVARDLPEDVLLVRGEGRPGGPPALQGRPLSRRGTALAETAALLRRAMHDLHEVPRAFQDGTPALDAFPADLWERLLARRWRQSSLQLQSYKDPAGYRPLREVIAGYLMAARGVRCTADQVLVVNGSQQGISLAAQVLLDPGDAAWIEDPCYLGARGTLLSAGAILTPVPVDAEGMDVAAGEACRPDARLAFVTPSHQFPLGVTMSLPRRLALLDWAARRGAWVVEDDYDSEFRYVGRPLAALQGLDTQGRVIYSGTFSKVLFPALRLGYLVVPPDLVDAFAAARLMADVHSPVLEQAVVADFIAEGHFAGHIRRMRTLYAERQEALVEAARRELSGILDVAPAEAGMHLIGWLPDAVDDRGAFLGAAAHGVKTQPLSQYRIDGTGRGGLLLGYAATDAMEINRGAHRLAEALAPSPAL